MTKKSHTTNPTDSAEYQRRILNCENHLTDIETLLDGLMLLDQSITPDAITSMRVMPFIRLMHYDLVDHAASLRRELCPAERIEKASVS